MTPETIAALNLAKKTRRAVAFAKRLTDGAEWLLPDAAATHELNEAGLAVLAAGKSGSQVIAGEAWFIEARNPSPRLILVGAVHIAQALAPLGKMAGFDVVLVDPRRAFGSQERFPGIEIVNEWPDVAIDRLGLDAGTAIVALTHDAKLDDPALDRGLRSEAFYIGALGSRKTHISRLERLSALGHQPEALARVRGPVGLAIGAVTAPEIAISIISEVIAVLRRGMLATRPA